VEAIAVQTDLVAQAKIDKVDNRFKVAEPHWQGGKVKCPLRLQFYLNYFGCFAVNLHSS
jgi:hypothetical protein